MTREDIILFIERNIGDSGAYNNFIGSNRYVRCAYLYFSEKHNTTNIRSCVKMFMEAFSVKNCSRYEDIGLGILRNKIILSSSEAIFEGLIDSFIVRKRNVLENE